MECISYKKGYKYQLKENYTTDIPIKPDNDIVLRGEFIQLTREGKLTIKNGYAWDGPSGPTRDTPDFMRGSLVHDALYQLMREELLEKDVHRDPADRLLQQMCKEDGMCSICAWVVYKGVKIFGDPSADTDNKRPIIKAPKSCQ